MLTPSSGILLPVSPTRRQQRDLWQDESWGTTSLGCGRCPELSLCGGLRIVAAAFDCLDFCCRTPSTCKRVCRNNPDYASRVREVGTFNLENIPRTRPLPRPDLPDVVPVVFHGKSRTRALHFGAIGLPLYRMFDRRQGTVRFKTHADLCGEYGIAPGTPLVLTGTDRDTPLERWWGLSDKRREIIRSLSTTGVVLVTTPNYSLFTDVPRWTDLHAKKRIAIVHQEFLQEGVPAALHVNGRTQTDFEHWAEFVAARPEITHLAYEFATGCGSPLRREQHAAWLADIASAAGRSLDLVVRGGFEVRPFLMQHFAHVTVLDTTIFMKTMMRQRAVYSGDRVKWESAPTLAGQPLDDLMAENIETVGGGFSLVAAPAN